MDTLLGFLSEAWPLLSLAAVLVSIALALSSHARRLEKHAALMERIEVRVDNLHGERRRAYVQSLQGKLPIPPGTIQVTDEELIIGKDTRPYPKGKPPEEGT